MMMSVVLPKTSYGFGLVVVQDWLSRCVLVGRCSSLGWFQESRLQMAVGNDQTNEQGLFYSLGAEVVD